MRNAAKILIIGGSVLAGLFGIGLWKIYKALPDLGEIAKGAWVTDKEP